MEEKGDERGELRDRRGFSPQHSHAERASCRSGGWASQSSATHQAQDTRTKDKA